MPTQYPATMIKRTILVFLLLFASSFALAAPNDDFITTWRTGVDETIVLPISGSPTFFDRVNFDSFLTSDTAYFPF